MEHKPTPLHRGVRPIPARDLNNIFAIRPGMVGQRRGVTEVPRRSASLDLFEVLRDDINERAKFTARQRAVTIFCLAVASWAVLIFAVQLLRLVF